MPLGHVVEIWRYPVKSLGGEMLTDAIVGAEGLAGDRHWAVLDTGVEEIRSAKRWPELLHWRASYDDPAAAALGDYDAAVATVTLIAPDGRRLHSTAPHCDAQLSEWLQRPARLSRRRPPTAREHYRLASARTAASMAAEMAMQAGEAPPDYSAMSMAVMAPLADCATPPGSYVDAFPLHLLSRNNLAWLGACSGLDTDVRRFRPNLLVDIDGAATAPAEHAWVGWRIAIGAEVILRIDSPTVRCAMPGRAQPLFGLAEQTALTRALVTHAQRQLGVNVIVEQGGTVRAGDPIRRID